MTEPLTIADDKQIVLAVLDRHRGRASAISKEALAAECGLNERHVRNLIVSLIKHHGAAIGSSSSPPAGYFLIQTAADNDAAKGELRHRIIQLARRLAMLQQNTPDEVLDQLKLALCEAEPTDEEETIG